MRRLNSNASTDDSEKWKIPYVDIIAVGTIQFLLSIVPLCYGVYLMQFVDKNCYNFKSILWTAVAYSAAFKITSPWIRSYCKHLDNIEHKVHKRNIVMATVVLFGGLTTAKFVDEIQGQIFFYGAFTGTLSAVISIHVKYATCEVFKSRPRVFDTLDQIVKPFCLILMPHLVLLLCNVYGPLNSQPVIAAVILNIIPACLLIKTITRQKPPLCKFQTMDKLSMEMIVLNRNKTPTTDEPSSSEDDDEDLCVEITPTTPPTDAATNVQMYFQTAGVKILPNIPEEIEWEDEDDINEISNKRLSKISAILQGLNTFKHVNTSQSNLYQPDDAIDLPLEEEFPHFVNEPSLKKHRCFSISSQTKFVFKRRQQEFKNFATEHFLKSFPKTLSKIYFYPAVVSSSITTILSTVIIATAPTVMLVKSWDRNNHMTSEEAAFVLTIIGFTWMFFLAGYPIFSKLSSIKIKLLFLIGLSISGLSLYVAQKFTYDNFTLFSLSFGLGHGITNYTETIACEDFFGKTNWKRLQGALEISTGFIVITIYLSIYFCNADIIVLLNYAYWPYVFNVSLWIIVYISKQAVTQFKTIRAHKRDKFLDLDFL